MGMKSTLALAATGMALVVGGVALVYPPAALVVAGIFLLAVSWLALDALGADR